MREPRIDTSSPEDVRGVQDVLRRLDNLKGETPSWTARCPAHDDKHNSLSVSEGADGKILLHCHAGCDFGAIAAKVGLKSSRGNGNSNGRGEPVATYVYRDERGQAVFYRDRFEWFVDGSREKAVYPRRLDGTRRGSPPVPYNLDRVSAAVQRGEQVLFVEGEKCADALTSAGFVATTTGSATSWRSKFAAHFSGARIVLWPDCDGPGEQYITMVGHDLQERAKELRVLRFSDKPDGWDAADFFANGGTAEQLDILLSEAPLWTKPKERAVPRSPTHLSPVEPLTLELVTARFEKWLYVPDPIPLYAVVGAVAANRLPGDAVWLGVVGPPSSMKTELLIALKRLPDLHFVATITQGGLLSGTSKRERAKNAKGGLLKQIGEFGILVLKDFTSVLSMRPDAKAETLAALREIYDGSWTRHLGTDGGQELSWSGKLGLIFGVTPAIDSHHAVIGAMGERFLLCRVAPAGREQAVMALEHSGKRTATMREELADAVAGLFSQPLREPRELTEAERERLVSLACLAVRIRSTVERDRQTREIESIHGAEGPARLVLSLERLLAGLDAIGCHRDTALKVVERVGLDSVPPLRKKALDAVKYAATPDTRAVADALGLPTITTRRLLEDLAAYSLVRREGKGIGNADIWTIGELA